MKFKTHVPKRDFIFIPLCNIIHNQIELVYHSRGGGGCFVFFSSGKYYGKHNTQLEFCSAMMNRPRPEFTGQQHKTSDFGSAFMYQIDSSELLQVLILTENKRATLV